MYLVHDLQYLLVDCKIGFFFPLKDILSLLKLSVARSYIRNHGVIIDEIAIIHVVCALLGVIVGKPLLLLLLSLTREDNDNSRTKITPTTASSFVTIIIKTLFFFAWPGDEDPAMELPKD